MTQPLHNLVTQNLSRTVQNRVTLLFCNIIFIVVMQSISEALLPHNIIEFELAYTTEVAQRMLNTWQSNNAMRELFFLLGVDYLFMFLYSFSIWFACVSLAGRVTPRLAHWIVVLAWLQPIAGVLDGVENFALFHISIGDTSPSWPLLSYYCAMPKFVIVLIGILTWIIGSVVMMFRKK